MATTLAALAGAWLINRWSDGRKAFAPTRSIAKFLAISFVQTAAISSGIAIGAPAFADAVSVAHSLNPSMITWIAWWLFDAVAMVMITPVVLLWAATPLDRSSKAIGEAAGILFAAIAIGVVSFSPSNYLDGLFPYRAALGIFVLCPLLLCMATNGMQPRPHSLSAPAFCGAIRSGLAHSRQRTSIDHCSF